MPKKFVLLLTLLAGLNPPPSLGQLSGTVLIPAGAVWKYQDTGLDPGIDWNLKDFDENGWPFGPAPLGFGETNHATMLSYGPDEDTNVVPVTRGPYLHMRTSSSILVRWRTEQPTDSYVLCGTNLSNLDRAFSDAQWTTEHQLGLSNLQAETTYYYAVGSLGAVALSAPDMFFTTAPPIGTNRPTRVWFVSDYGFQNEGEMAVRDSYFAFTTGSGPAQVWLTGGDNDQSAGNDADIQTSVFGIYAPLLRNTPIWPTLGNHDTYTDSVPGPYPFYDNFTLPTNGEAGGVASGSEHYYSFDYANIHFITMDSIAPALSASTNTPMLRWLREDLAQTRQPWKIAYWHGPPYTKGSHDSDDPFDLAAYMIQMRENAVPILEAYGVDLVLCGHSHVYERSYFLHGHYGYSWDFSETNKVDGGNGREDGDGPYRKRSHRGAVYVVAAVGSNPYGFYYDYHPAHCVNIGDQFGSCMMDIYENRLDFQFFNASSEVLDHFTILKETPAPPRITGVSYAQNTISLTWASTPGERYQVYCQASLTDPAILIADQIQAHTGSTSWSGPVDSLQSMGFFLVALSPTD